MFTTTRPCYEKETGAKERYPLIISQADFKYVQAESDASTEQWTNTQKEKCGQQADRMLCRL